MSAAIFRSNGKTIVNFISILVSKPAIFIHFRVGQILTISDFWPVTIWYFKPGLWLGWAWLGWAGQAARAWLGLAGQMLARQPDWAGRLGWEAARLGWAGLAELSEQWQGRVKCRIQAPTSITDSMDQ